jgi:hypothetical protein
LKGEGIDTAFRTSGLYRDKWERDDYRNRTIAKALENVSIKADDQPKGLLDSRNGKIAISTAEPPARDWTVNAPLYENRSPLGPALGKKGFFKAARSMHSSRSQCKAKTVEHYRIASAFTYLTELLRSREDPIQFVPPSVLIKDQPVALTKVPQIP